MTSYHTFDANHKLQLLLPPADQGDVNTSWVSPFVVGEANRAVFMFVIGAVGANLDAKITQAQDSGGTGAKDITGAALTAITTTTDNVIATIELAPGSLDDVNGFTYVRAEVTVAGASTGIYAVVYMLHSLRYPIAGDQHSTYSQYVRAY